MAGGVAVFDYNNDGYLDIFFTNGADIQTLKKTSPKYSNRLFANDGKGHFTDVTEKAGLAGDGYDMGVAVGDYDNDGYEDLFVGGVHGNHLYHNNGDGTFTDVTEKAGIDQPDSRVRPALVGRRRVGGCQQRRAAGSVRGQLPELGHPARSRPARQPGGRDYCHPKFYKTTPNQLFLNNGDGTFRDVSAESGIRAHPGKGHGRRRCGLRPGRLDGYFRHQRQARTTSLFHNKGGGKFEEVAFEANVALARRRPS